MRRLRLAAALATSLVLLGACGSQAGSSANTSPPAEAASSAGSNSTAAAAVGSPATDASPAPGASPAPAAAAGPSAADALPKVMVRNVADDQFVTMADFVTAGTPVLVWFWAPH